MSRITFRQAAVSTAAAMALAAGATGTAEAAAGATTVASNKAVAKRILAANGLNAAQFNCFSSIIQRESGWNHRAVNSSSGAYGLAQALPGGKMTSAGADWRTNPATQVKWAVGYMKGRYGSPCGAWSFWLKNRWY